MTRSAFRLGLAIVLCALPLTPRASVLHVHGRATLAVAIDDNAFILLLKAPTDNLVGFERAPRTARERAAVARMKQTLEQPAALFVPSADAACRSTGVTLRSALFEQPGARRNPGTHAGEHADLEGEFVFRCARPKALRELDIRLFDAFPYVRKIRVDLTGPRGRTSIQLTPMQRKVNW